jgi:Leucine-rich repeat (LRR) protein
VRQEEEMKKQHRGSYEPYRHITVSLLLGYNQIRSVEGLGANVMKIRGVPNDLLHNLMWLDLQHNFITSIPREEFCQFPNLKSLYLHRNYIVDLRELENLNMLDKLINLTIHGNPVDRIPNFRYRYI